MKSITSNKKLLTLAITSIPVLGYSFHSNAQTNEAAQAASPMLEEVIVTATRRDTDAQSTSIAITAFDSNSLTRAGVDDMRQVAQLVPNVYMGESAGAASTPITIRGVGDNQLGLGGDGSIAIYVDGVYQGRPYANVLDLLNIERLEILRGPQGALYGRNATGGAINVRTKAPSDQTEVFGDLKIGNYGALRTRLGASGPLDEDNWFGAISVSWSDRDGYARNKFDGKKYNSEETFNVQSEVRYVGDNDLELSIKADYGYNDATLAFYSFIDIVDPATFPFNPASAVGITDTDKVDVNSVNIDGLPPFEDREWWGLSATVSKSFSKFDLTATTAYRENSFTESTDADALPLSLAVFDLLEDQEQWSQSLILTSTSDSRLSWVLGADYFSEKTEGFQHTEIPIFGAGVYVDAIASNQTDAYAIYGEATYEFADDWSLILGLRYSDETKKYTFQQVSLGLDNISTVSGDITFNSWTPRLVLQYQISEDMFSYFSFSNGFKSGGFSAINPVALATSTPAGHPDRFDQEDVAAYELGLKSEWLENRLRINGAAFLYDYSDLHTNVTDAIGFAKVVPAKQADVRGVELETTLAVTSNLRLWLNLGYLDATYDAVLSFPNGLGGTQVSDLRGNFLPRAPKWSGSATINYSQYLSSGNLDWRLDWIYSDEHYLTEANDVVDRENSSTRVNARVSYEFSNSPFEVDLFVNNATDVRLKAHSKPILGIVYRGMLTPPKTYGLEFRFRF